MPSVQHVLSGGHCEVASHRIALHVIASTQRSGDIGPVAAQHTWLGPQRLIVAPQRRPSPVAPVSAVVAVSALVAESVAAGASWGAALSTVTTSAVMLESGVDAGAGLHATREATARTRTWASFIVGVLSRDVRIRARAQFAQRLGALAGDSQTIVHPPRKATAARDASLGDNAQRALVNEAPLVRSPQGQKRGTTQCMHLCIESRASAPSP